MRDEMPEWVHVWYWLRFMRDPQDMTPLPQQGINPEAMSMAEYEERHEEWQRAGAPRHSVERIVRAMGVDYNPLLDPELVA